MLVLESQKSNNLTTKQMLFDNGLRILWPAWGFFHLTEVLRHSVPAGTECPIKLSNFSPTYADDLQWEEVRQQINTHYL